MWLMKELYKFNFELILKVCGLNVCLKFNHNVLFRYLYSNRYTYPII